MPRRRGYAAQPGVSTQGFNPGNRPKPHRALKVCQTEHGKNTPLPCNHLSPFQGDSLDGMIPRVETLG
jgi:hypothetical protein